MVLLTQLPLQALLRDYMGRIVKWGTMLDAYDVKYMPRIAIKGQVLVDFIAEFIENVANKGKGIVEIMTISVSVVPTWEVYTDGVANRKGAGVGAVLITPEKLVMEKLLRLGFLAMNNGAEYKALLARMAMVNKLKGEVIEVYLDSRLMVGQVNEKFKAQDECMQRYLVRVKQARVQFKGFTLKQIPRGQNSHADFLAMLATSLGSNLTWVVIVTWLVPILWRSLWSGYIVSKLGQAGSTLLITFLKQELLAEDKVESEKICRKALHYWFSEEQKLYKRSH